MCLVGDAMIDRVFFSIMMALVMGLAPASVSYALSGDADGNGTLNMDDARIIARYLSHQVSVLPSPADADATQDGKVDMEDAFVIAKQQTGQSRIVVVAPQYGSPATTRAGDTLRIQVFEKFFPFNITGGTVRIQSASSAYDSGDKPLTFDRDGRSLYYYWNTTGLKAAADYQITVNLTGPATILANTAALSSQSLTTSTPSDATVALAPPHYEPTILASIVDAAAPTPGISLVFRRVVRNDSNTYVYAGPLGKAWVHSYDISLDESTDGRIAAHGLNRTFTAKGDGGYQAYPGDYGQLSRDNDGTFQLKEKNGLVYRFRSDLKLDYIKDTNGNQITAVYDDSKRLIKMQHSAGPAFTLEYNASGQIGKLTDHAGRVTRYDYFYSGCPSNGSELIPPCQPQAQLAKVTDPSGVVTQYDSTLGISTFADNRLKSIQYPDGVFTQYEYDDNARVVKITGTWGANPVAYSYGANSTTTITDTLGAQTQIQVNDRLQPILRISADGGQISNSYDNAANLVSSTDPLGHATQFAYDEFGNVTLATNPLGQMVQTGYDLRFNKPSTVTDPLGHVTAYSYDAGGNLMKTVFADGTSENYTYDGQGNPLSFQNAGGKTTQYAYNSLGRVTGRTDALSHLTQFAYDPAGDLKTVTDAKGHAVSNTRDALGRLTKRTYPDGSHEDYVYDSAGKITSLTNRRGQTISLAYDNTGKLEWKTYASGKKLHYFYDNAGYLNRVERVEGSAAVLEAAYEFDSVHRVTKVKVPRTTVPNTYDMTYRYDLAGNRTQAFYPDGYELDYSYDAANRLIRIAEANGATVVAYEYDAAGRRTKRTLGNRTYTTYAYNTVNQLTELVNYSPAGVVQSRFAYDYNATGLRTRMTTLEGQHNYSYDDTNQLTQVQYPDAKTVQYGFDAVGNRSQVTENGAATAYTTNDLDQYTQVGNQTLSYDGNGNLASQTDGAQTTAYGWDEDDRLVSVDKNGVHVDFRYDHRGLLVGKSVGGVDTRYVWDGIHIAAEVDNSGTILRRFVYGANIDEILVVTAGSAKHWAQQDGLGSVVGTTDNSGTAIAAMAYDVYGNVRGGDLGPVPQRFAGMWWDANIKKYYVRSRWYDPLTSKFLSPDPLVGIDINRYAYVVNSPVQYIDPVGLWYQDSSSKLWLPGEPVTPKVSVINAVKWGVIVTAYNVVSRMPIIIGGGYKNAYDFFYQWVSGGPSLTVGDFWRQRLYNQAYGSDNGSYYDLFGNFHKKQDEVNDDSCEKNHNCPTPPPHPREIGGGGGSCPTFIQSGQQQILTKTETNAQASLTAKMFTPWSQSLLRSDIPIFGTAKGSSFARYRVEYGHGSKPDSWQTIFESDQPQESTADFNDLSWMQGDIDIRGNLATWNTGLKEWVHLPWHPSEDPTDLNGLYTLRLTVFGKDGQQAEDQMPVEVGRVVAQSLPGMAQSPDRRVAMRFPEQALTHPFRVYTILPTTEVGEETPKACDGCELLGPVYRIREPGDRFIKDVALEFTLKPEDLGGRKTENVGIVRYDVEKQQWLWLDSVFDKPSNLFRTTLAELPATKALYALAYQKGEARSKAPPPTSPPPTMLKPLRPGLLVENDFETGLGTFKPRDRFVGAVLTRDKEATKDGSYALKFSHENFGGNFSATVLDKPFDAREHNILSFDYRIKPGVKIDFYLKVNGRWYRLIFTGDPFDFRNRDVNIGSFGWIEGVIADDQWHTAGVDLYYFLSQQTRHTRVEEIIMADWRATGYRKLDFGSNAREAVYYLDNFHIASKGKPPESSPVLPVDGFEVAQSKNAWGGPTGIYTTPGTNFFQVGLIDVPATGKTAQAAKKTKAANRALNMAFDFMQAGAYGGYWTSLAGKDLSDYSTLAFRLYAPEGLPPLKVGIRGKQGAEGKAAIAPYASSADAAGWREVRVPMTALRGIWQFATPDVLFISGSYQEGRGKGNVWIDDLRFERTPNPKVADFEMADNWTLLGGDMSILENGAAALSARRMADPDKPGNSVMRIAYGGSIGKDYGPKGGGFSYASWDVGLNGTDARPFKYLTLRIRGEKGGETPNFYLNDAATRYPLRTRDLQPITKEWQTIRLPLAFYAEHGVDLSHVESLQMVFEWNEQTGTVYIDDMAFE